MAFDLEGVPRDREVRDSLKQQLLEGNYMGLQNNFTPVHQARDMSRPVVMPYVYREYPKTLYHPTQKTPRSVLAQAKVLKHNELHPDKPELVPQLEIVSMIVNDEAEEKAWLAKGWSLTAPAPDVPKDELAELAGAGLGTDEEECPKCGAPKHAGRCKAK